MEDVWIDTENKRSCKGTFQYHLKDIFVTVNHTVLIVREQKSYAKIVL